MCLQRTSGDHAAMTKTFKGDPVYPGSMPDWWQQTEELLAESATRAGLSVAWVALEEAAKWEAQMDGVFEQTDMTCLKEQVDQALQQVVADFSHPAVLLDPFLPECPVIALNQAAQTLTGWDEVGMNSGVAYADSRLEETHYAGGAGGAYHVNYGAFSKEEVLEQLAVRTACCNGRPCVATFRRMYEFPSKEPVFMKLQGVTIGQGIIKGALSGGEVWYLIGILGQTGGNPEEWSASSEAVDIWASLSEAVEKAMTQNEAILAQPVPTQDTPHPYGGQVATIRRPIWHTAVPHA